MYVNESNHFPLVDEMFATIDEYPFGVLVAPGDPPIATHMPFLLDRAGGENGTLLCHTPRADPIWRQFNGQTQMLVVFSGPSAYISPSWYPEGTRVPTYSFKAVHAYGRPEIIDSGSEIVEMLRELVERHEARSGTGWRFEEIPQHIYAGLRPAIVPFRMRIDRLEGKIRVGQNRGRRDRESVIAGLRARGQGYDTLVADMIETGPTHREAPYPLLSNIPKDIVGGDGARELGKRR